MDIIAITSVTTGHYNPGQGRDLVSSHYFAALYANGTNEEFHFTVGLNHKDEQAAEAACKVYRAKLAKQADVI